MSEFVISYRGVKRRLCLPFKICCTEQQIQELIDALVYTRDCGRCGMGWRQVATVEKHFEEEVNQSPREWDEWHIRAQIGQRKVNKTKETIWHFSITDTNQGREVIGNFDTPARN